MKIQNRNSFANHPVGIWKTARLQNEKWKFFNETNTLAWLALFGLFFQAQRTNFLKVALVMEIWIMLCCKLKLAPYERFSYLLIAVKRRQQYHINYSALLILILNFRVYCSVAP